MTWDSKWLREPTSADNACGNSLEDTQLLASFDAYRLFGRAVPFGETGLDKAPDWRELRDRSADALRQSKDLRLLAHYAAAVLRTDGLSAFLEVIAVAEAWVTQYWDLVYPRIEDDAVLRKNALSCFSDRVAIVDGVRRAPIAAHRQLGVVDLRRIEQAATVAAGGTVDATDVPTEQQLLAIFAAGPVDELRALGASAASSLDALQSIEARMRDAGGSRSEPEFALLKKSLEVLKSVCKKEADIMVPTGEVSEDPVAPAGGEAGASSPRIIRSRQDAIRALDAVAAFFRRSEPSSPVPLFLDRAKRLVDRSFLDILADVAPDALAQAKSAGGIKDEG